MKSIRGLGRGAIVLIGLLAMFCRAGSVRATATVFVDASSGSDITGNGSQAKPWQTIGKALDSITGTAVNPYQVLVAQGTYYESELHPGEYESVFGGYNPNNWARDIETYQTVVDGGEEEVSLFWGEDHCTFDGLYLQNAERGVFCFGGSPTIRRCHISNCDKGISTAEGAAIRQNILLGNGYSILAGTNTGFITRIYNNLIILNTQGSVPSGIASVSNNMYCINNTIDSNENGIRIQKSPDDPSPVALLQNNNITRNGSVPYHAGIYLSDTGYFAVDPDLITICYNNVWDNSTDYKGCSPGEGDISQDPLYRSPAAGGSGYERLQTAEALDRVEDLYLAMEAEERRAWGQGHSAAEGRSTLRRGGGRTEAADYDYQLLEGSPSIDAGTNENAPSQDLLGFLRPNPSTAISDIGCYEYYSTPPPPPPVSPSWITDYNGDGTSDIAVFRSSSGLWAVRGITRAYFGSSSDLPVPGDYTGDGITDIAIFRESAGLWVVRGNTRVYFGSSADEPFPGDYDGDGTADLGIFRSSSGLWAIRGVTRMYFGSVSDMPIPGYYGGSTAFPAIFRSSTALWAIKGITRAYFGTSADEPVPGDYAGSGSWAPAIFRPALGLWVARGVTRTYFGSSADEPIPGGYRGDGKDYPAVFRGSSGLWAVKGETRVYFGSGSDLPVTR